jgi:hypothetical protein
LLPVRVRPPGQGDRLGKAPAAVRLRTMTRGSLELYS